MHSEASRRFWKCFDRLPVDVQNQAEEAFNLWKSNPRHPSLHFKRVHPSKPCFSVRIGLHWRAVGVLDDDIMTWFWMGSHGDYDKLVDQL